jgi:hypothetical protein
VASVDSAHNPEIKRKLRDEKEAALAERTADHGPAKVVGTRVVNDGAGSATDVVSNLGGCRYRLGGYRRTMSVLPGPVRRRGWRAACRR